MGAFVPFLFARCRGPAFSRPTSRVLITALVVGALSGQAFAQSDQTSDLLPVTGAQFANNLVTVQCPGMPDGVVFELNGRQYRVVYSKEDALRYAETACTSNLTDLSDLGLAFFNMAQDAGLLERDTAEPMVGPDGKALSGQALLWAISSELWAQFNTPVAHWDTSQVTDMTGAFAGAAAFNQPIDRWNTAKVRSMRSMFEGASSFNKPIADWDTSSVTDMSRMFANACRFDQSIGDWETFKVTTMAGMFYGACDFNQDVQSLDTSNVRDMSEMFGQTLRFNQPLAPWLTQRVENMAYMFYGAVSFNQPLAQWDVRNVQNMEGMFAEAISFDQPLLTWSVDRVENMWGMFAGATQFKQNLMRWSISPHAAESLEPLNSFFLGSGLSDRQLPRQIQQELRRAPR